MKTNFRASMIVVFAALAWIAAPVFSILKTDAATPAAAAIAPCPSGRSAARLTGWMMNNKMPVGKASYDEQSQRLEVSVDSVSLPDGHQLAVLVGDNRIGELKALSGGSAAATINRIVKEGSRVRVLDDDRPVVSGNLVCDNSQPAPTVPPSPTPTPTVSPTPEPTVTPPPTPAPSPTLKPVD